MRAQVLGNSTSDPLHGARLHLESGHDGFDDKPGHQKELRSRGPHPQQNDSRSGIRACQRRQTELASFKAGLKPALKRPKVACTFAKPLALTDWGG